ncbi:MAG TPA: class I SAM-dependent methyltransferase [Acidimicrobiia bacterium]
MTGYWQSADEDEAMQNEHVFVWDTMLDSVDTDLAAKRVLDIGCNRGGFLRLLCDRTEIAEGFGYDPASEAVADARRLAGERPLHFETAATVPAGWDGFDVAFSHEALYLIHDIPTHASDVFRALAPGASYYAVMGVHTGSPVLSDWHAAHSAELNMPPLNDIDDVVASFESAGFTAAASRLKVGFIPATGHTPRLLDWLEYYNETKLLLRFTRPLPSMQPH